MVFCLLGLFMMTNWSCKKKVAQTPVSPSVSQQESNPPIEAQNTTEPESIKTLQNIALQSFDEQMKAYFEESPDKEAKIKAFEESMDNLAFEYYRYYVQETKEGLETAKLMFTKFLTTFKSADGVGLSKDSIPYYLERLKAK